MRQIVRALAQLFPTAIVSGRGREKVKAFVKLKELYYAGSHGMDIAGPQARSIPYIGVATNFVGAYMSMALVKRCTSL